MQELLCYKKNVIFVLPYVSIVQEKVRALAPFALELGFHLQVLLNTLARLCFTHSVGVCWGQGHLPTQEKTSQEGLVCLHHREGSLSLQLTGAGGKERGGGVFRVFFRRLFFFLRLVCW